jgi:tetratricopeptide (TPR) repeat protein
MKNIFVLMPFNEDFDDVYHIIRDSGSQASKESNVGIKVFRADDISKPGRISIQVLNAIRESDMIVADLTGSNPNVMYELGFAHALEKTVVLLNQAVHDSPFDVKDFRQITYERTKLSRDCRPRLISAIKSVIESDGTPESNELPVEAVNQNKPIENETIVRRPGVRTVAELQELHIELQINNKLSNSTEVRKAGIKVRELIDTVTIVGIVDHDDSKNTAASMGNCAVELEKGEEYKLAEEIFSRAISLFPDYAGLRLQYSDFLFDQGREGEARAELDKAKQIDPNDHRIARLEMKFSAQGSNVSEDIGNMLKQQFESEPSNNHKAATYLLYLSKTENPDNLFEEACNLWEANITLNDKASPRRALADYFAKRDPARAIKIYESIIDDPNMDSSNRHDALHNMATLYAQNKDREKAIKCWKTAYAADRNDHTVKAAFSQRLAAWGDFELAKKVIHGLPIE